MERASGNYFILLDSDCILPKDYLLIVENALDKDYADACEHVRIVDTTNHCGDYRARKKLLALGEELADLLKEVRKLK